MINIIADSCVGADITQGILKQEFINPFCWSIVDVDSFCYLIKNYHNIDFYNFTLQKHKVLPKYSIIVDGCVKIFYEHYIEDPEQHEILKKNNNVYFFDIKQYIYDKYISRLKMNKNPIFIVGHTWNINKSKRDDYEKIILSNSLKFPLIIIVNLIDDFNYLKKYENCYIKIYLTDLHKNNSQLAFNVFHKYIDIFQKNNDLRKNQKNNKQNDLLIRVS